MADSEQRVHRLSIVGGGNMGEALVGGLVRAGWDPNDIVIVEVDETRRAALASEHGVDVSDRVVSCGGAVIAVKPADVRGVCKEIARLEVPRVLSLAAGITLAALEHELTTEQRAIRAMPNTPALVGEGVAAICGGPSCTEDDLRWAESILGAVGTVVRVPETQIDAVTAVSGSGPGYVFLFAEALIEAAVAEGLPPAAADALVRQMIKGAGVLYAGSAEDAVALRRRVTSPHGTTAAGVAALEDGRLRDIIAAAVRAATIRSRELAVES